MRALTSPDAHLRFAAALARRLWIAMVIALVVAAGALFLYARPAAPWQHAYVATQAVRILTNAGSASTSYDAYLATEEAKRLAREIASGSVFSSASFGSAVASALQARHSMLVSHFGADVPGSVSASDVAAALSATDTGDVVTIGCRWSGAAGANAILSAAIEILTGSDDLRTLLSPNAGIETPDEARVTFEGAFTAAQLDSTAQEAARQELLARTILGIFFGLAVAMLLAGLSMRWGVVRRPASAAAPDATLASNY